MENNKIIKCFTFLSMIIIPFGIMFLLGGCRLFIKEPPEPEIKHGEFPFRLTYEKDDKVIVVKDTLICDFDGYGFNAARGKFRKWKSHLASGERWITLLRVDEIEIFFAADFGEQANAAVYMGDTEIYGAYIESALPLFAYYINIEDISKYDIDREKDEFGRRARVLAIHADELWKKYKIRLISWEPSEPIENTFK